MSGAPVSLDSIATKIPQEDAHFHRETVADLLDRKQTNFPGAQPVSFARRHLTELRHTDYFMCEKTDGIRCLMFLTEITINHQPAEAQFLVDRRNDYYYVQTDSLHLPVPGPDVSMYHRGTLLDGELVKQKLKNGFRLAYLIFDILAIDGENVTQKGFDKRLARIQEHIAKPLKDFSRKYPDDVAAQPFQVAMKEMEFPYGTEMMFRDKIPNLPHGNDGLIFTSREDKYTFGTDPKILKWKPPHENTIDFRLVLGAFPMERDEEGEYEDWDAMPDMELWVNHGDGQGKGYRFFDVLTVREAEWDALKKLGQQLDGRVIECYRDPDADRGVDVWRPKLDDGVPRFRDDKKDANHISTVDSVLESIRDAVTEQDLKAEAHAIRTAYKERLKVRQEAEKRRVEEERRRYEEEKRRAAEEAARREAAAVNGKHEAQQNGNGVKDEEEEDDDGPVYSED
ncbi:Dcp1p-Dcp2p decapping enzyme complex alpha subunit [Saxophila tyrrhenica]|uniref:mRNA-capping enzyme subunit alpha n=1 Tax=Saxophila tyrrhenica TaxID=1690608 RepID=A0AAV9PMU8_9PEZI|nr:Dcp1p-Dcp2p decapping enzyme complex alpha subunit [Saxophila tyrrhenica]